MNRKCLFLLKCLGFSLPLFIFWHQLLYGYTYMMGEAMSLLNPHYHLIPRRAEKFLNSSSTSMTMIAFIALMLATPGVPLVKKAAALVTGLVAFFLTDWLFLQYVIFPLGKPFLNDAFPSFELYLCIKWLLPFLVWLIFSYQHLGNFFQLPNKISQEAMRKSERQ